MEITKIPQKILNKKLESVQDINKDIEKIIEIMKETMVKAHGIGLAANQIGLDMQIFVIDEKIAKENNVPDAYINPELLEYSKEASSLEEGCLSIPNEWFQIERAKKIKIKAKDIHGKSIKIKARGFLARVLQHEYDHLQGILISKKAHS